MSGAAIVEASKWKSRDSIFFISANIFDTPEADQKNSFGLPLAIKYSPFACLYVLLAQCRTIVPTFLLFLI